MDFEHQTLVIFGDDREFSFLAARILEADFVAFVSIFDAITGNRHDRGLGSAPYQVIRNEANAPGRDRPSQRITFRTDVEYPGSWLEVAGTDFLSCQIHDDPAMLAGVPAGCSHVPDHPGPHVNVIVRAVDSCDAHSGQDHFLDERVIVAGSARQRDHDADITVIRRLAENGLLVRIGPRFPELERPRIEVLHRGRRARHRPQRSSHHLDRRHHIALGTIERREPERCQVLLELADIAFSQRQVVHEIKGAIAIFRMHRRQLPGEF